MKAYSLIFGYFCINMAIWTLNMAGLIPAYAEATISPTGVQALFDLNVFTAITGVVGGVTIGILSMLTRNSALGTGVLLLWIVGILFKPIQDLFVGLPLLINTILPTEISFISQVVVAFSAISLFVFIVGILAGREIT